MCKIDPPSLTVFSYICAMNPIDIIRQHYRPDTPLYDILVVHSEQVARKALSVLRLHPSLRADETFVYEAAMLHDIGIILCDAPGICCHGSYPYICHGYLGADMLRRHGLTRHALVAERHTGTGLTAQEIEQRGLPLPQGRIYEPQSVEEQVICYADKFFSKTHPDEERSIERVRRSLEKFGAESTARFDAMHALFG